MSLPRGLLLPLVMSVTLTGDSEGQVLSNMGELPNGDMAQSPTRAAVSVIPLSSTGDNEEAGKILQGDFWLSSWPSSMHTNCMSSQMNPMSDAPLQLLLTNREVMQ